jgi:hypothetical protein
MAAVHDRRLLQPKLPHQDRSRYNHTRIQIPGRYHSVYGFESNSWQLDSKSDSEEGYRDQQLPVRDHGGRCCGTFTQVQLDKDISADALKRTANTGLRTWACSAVCTN